MFKISSRLQDPQWVLQSESGSGLAEGQSKAYGAECEGEGFNQYGPSQVCQQISVCVCVCVLCQLRGIRLLSWRAALSAEEKHALHAYVHPPTTHTHTLTPLFFSLSWFSEKKSLLTICSLSSWICSYHKWFWWETAAEDRLHESELHWI